MKRDDNHLTKRKSYKLSFIIITSILIGIFLLSLGWGRYPIPVKDVLSIMGNLLTGQADFDDTATSVFFHIRLPRVIVAFLIGAALSVAGAIFQGMFRNPLVSPDILGVSSGSSFGAALGILIPFAGIYTISISAFMFGIIAMFIAYTISKASKGDSVITLVLAGMVVSALFSAALSLLQYLADPYEQLPAIVFWIMGGFFRINWEMAIGIIVTIIPCLILAYFLGWKLDILSLGDEEASSLGVNVKWLRLVLIVIGTFMVAASVSVAGTVSWVGLVIPHIARMLSSSEHTISIPMSALVGGTFVLLMDDLARSITTSEIPISVLTSALGAPFFAYLLIMRSNKVWNR